MSKRVCVIGLDCAAPELVFDRYREYLPTFQRIMASGPHGPLESIIPPITVPAWMCMMTGKDPGTLGIYGFRNRKNHTYHALEFAGSHMVHEPAIWDVAGENGLESLVIGVPLTYPPKPIRGALVSDFLAPDTSSNYTYPSSLREEIAENIGDYILDVRDFRNRDREDLLSEIYAMTDRRFALARHLMNARPWNLSIMVEMGTDRMHHAFWRYMDSEHPLHEPGHPFANAIRDYYIYLDGKIASFIEALDEETTLLIVSDHGAKRMIGGFCFNQWLIAEGYLVLKKNPEGETKFSPDLVDWKRTRAWGDGGYYGRLFLNIAGREPQGIVTPEEVEELKTELTMKLEALPDDHGRLMGTKVYRPERVYSSIKGVPPDLIVYFGDLYWRSVGSLGHPTFWTHTNDTGPDDANHAQKGIFLMSRISDLKGVTTPADTGWRDGLSIFDVAPTALSALGLKAPEGMGRRSVNSPSAQSADSAYSQEEEAELARRLEELGYI